jgi:type II secretory ATPase GspE/PulE/Tfp pilus assembly ATPase PilB-like protein/ActR/RegA family two-component response regulator/RNA polymerase subunit RPABC4/transcription elongation factor Spt4
MDSLGSALVQSGVIEENRLAEIQGETKGSSYLVEIYRTMEVDENAVVNILAGRFRFPKADLSNIMPEALGKFSRENALKYMCIPFERTGKRLKVGMLDPLDLKTIEDVSFLTGCLVLPHVASKSDFLSAIDACYDLGKDLTGLLDRVASAREGDIEFLQDPSEGALEEVFQTGKRQDLVADENIIAPAIKLVNLIIREAMRCRASDIHIEPGQKAVNVRFRIDGVLRTHTQIPKWLHAAMSSRIKIMSKLDISNRKTPQDGSMKLKVGNTQLDVRVSTLPTHLGEKVVMRLLNRQGDAIALPATGITDQDLLKIRAAISKPQGMMLMTGPTGSGKTTTLHAILKELHSEKTNIVTVEDPVEYELEGITQVHVNEKAGMTFANALRSILRQDPDVVMVGEIRDLETADIAFRAAMTGHLVLSTLHTSGTAATITRLFDLGIEPYLISSSLHCIVAQRLLRVNCKYCAEEYVPDAHVLSSLHGIKSGTRFMKGRGCEKCNHTGYNGRIAVLEIMEFTPSLRKLIAGRSTSGEIKEAARNDGMRSLLDAAMEQVYNGVTTPDEVLRVIALEDKKAETACGNCGRSYTGEDCPFCGKTEDVSCGKCRRILEIDWSFCPSCGAPRDKSVLPAFSSTPTALVVDDEFGILKMVELALKPLNLEVHTAQNGREALEKIAALTPNIVITDINMPVMDGFDFIRELRSDVSTMFIPVVILSSRDTAEDKLKGFTYGTDDYITKPFDYSELQARVKRLLKRTYG